jgi:hypothetical protein
MERKHHHHHHQHMNRSRLGSCDSRASTTRSSLSESSSTNESNKLPRRLSQLHLLSEHPIRMSSFHCESNRSLSCAHASTPVSLDVNPQNQSMMRMHVHENSSDSDMNYLFNFLLQPEMSSSSHVNTKNDNNNSNSSSSSNHHNMMMDRTRSPPQVRSVYVVQEIIRSEADYIYALSLMVEVFKAALGDSKILMAQNPQHRPSAFETLAVTTASLKQLHMELLTGFSLPHIQSCLSSLDHHSSSFFGTTADSDSNIAILMECILSRFRYILPYMKLYVQYCVAYKEVVALLATRPITKLPPHVQHFMTSLCKVASAFQVDMQLEMIKPVQRLCRYPLLLQEWLDAVSRVSPGVSTSFLHELHSLWSDAKAMASLVNERVHQYQNNLHLLDLRTRLVFMHYHRYEPPLSPSPDHYHHERMEVCHPTRHFLADCHIQLLTMLPLASLVPTVWVARPRTLILLSDLLLVTKSMRKHRLKVKNQGDMYACGAYRYIDIAAFLVAME